MFELRPFDHRNNHAMRTYDPFREMEEMERAFFGRPFGGERGFSALTEFRTDIQDKGDSYLLDIEAQSLGIETIDEAELLRRANPEGV